MWTLVWASFALHLAIVLHPVIALHLVIALSLAVALLLAIGLYPVTFRIVRTGLHLRSKSRGQALGTTTRPLYLLSEDSLRIAYEELAKNEGAPFRIYDHSHHPQMHPVSLQLNSSARRPLPVALKEKW